LHNFDLQALKLVFRADIAAAWRHVNGKFLLALLLGIVTAVASLARVLSWLLEHYPEPLWAFFFGLIFASALMLLRQVRQWRSPQRISLVLGVAFALLLAVAPRTEFIDGYLGVFLAGYIAICATLLPGISGSFVLLMLGMYSTVLAAVKNFELGLLMVLASGAVCGILSFSRLLFWFMREYRDTAVALLTGFLFGSLAIIWPWKRVLEWTTGSNGLPKPVQQLPVLPGEYLARTGDDPMLALCVATLLVGFLGVWVIDRHGNRLQVDIA
jgi:putative membrane protein